MRSVGFILFAAAATVAASFLLLPGERERYAMAVRDGDIEGALELARGRPAEQLSPGEALDFYRVALHLGYTQEAETYLLTYLERAPDDLDATDELVKFYRNNQDRLNYLSTLDNLFRRQPTARLFQELVGLYRMDGDEGAELECFEIAQAAGVAGPHDQARAGLLYAAAGQVPQGVSILAKIPVNQFRYFRQAQLSYVALLIKTGKVSAAADAASAIAGVAPEAKETVLNILAGQPEAVREFLELELLRDLGTKSPTLSILAK